MKKSSYYPLYLNIADRKCIVVGGGQVALRKVKTLLEYSARVEVISPDLCADLEKLAGANEINTVDREYQYGDLKEARIVIAATDDSDVNLKVVKEARDRGILINVVDCAEESDFILPSYLRRGDITIAVSTSGRSPALARKIRTKLERDFGNEYESLAVLVNEVRTEIRQRGIKINSEDWQTALDLDLLTALLKQGKSEQAKAILLENLVTSKSRGKLTNAT